MTSVTASQPTSEHVNMINTLLLESGGMGRVQNQNPTGRHIEQQRSVQLQELVPQITALREQLGSDVATAERDQVLRNQLTEVLSTITRADNHSQVAESTGKWMVKTLNGCGGA